MVIWRSFRCTLASYPFLSMHPGNCLTIFDAPMLTESWSKLRPEQALHFAVDVIAIGCNVSYRLRNADYGAAQMTAHHTANRVLDNSLHRCQLSLCMLLMPQHAQLCHALCCCIQLLSIMILILMVRLLLPALHSRLQINTNKIGNNTEVLSCIIKHYIWTTCCCRYNMAPQRSHVIPGGGGCTKPSSLS